MFKKILIAILFVVFGSLNITAQTKAIVGCNIVNPIGIESVENAVVVIKDNKIISIGKKGEIDIPKDAEIINAEGKWLIPGLIDSHVHFFQSGGIYTRPDIWNLKEIVPYADEMQLIQNNLDDTFKRYLRSGITSVVDMGGPFWNFKVREEANNKLLAPRVKVAGPLISTHHPKGLETEDQPIIKVNSIEEAVINVKKQNEKKTDFIKIWYVVRKGHTPEEYYDIVKATVDESHKNNIPVIIHATALETAKFAVRAGADILAHMVYDKEVDQEFIQLCLDNKIKFSTTVIVSEGYMEALTNGVKLLQSEFELTNPFVASTLFDSDFLSEEYLPKVSEAAIERRRNRIKTAQRNSKILYDAGVTICANTDAGNIGTLPGPSIFREFNLLNEAGLTPLQIITAATINNAKLMGMETELGSIEEGKIADLVLLNSSPIENILNSADINKVIKNGNILAPEDILKKTPAEFIQQHDNTYNAGDIDAFMNTYHPDIKIYNYPNKLRYSSKEEIRKAYSKLFKKYPNNHAEIVERVSHGKFVIDKERITGRNGEPYEVIAIYELKDNLIYRLLFLRK